jgi:GTP cyclohydrolase II
MPGNSDVLIDHSSSRSAAMAIDALRRGWPICIAQNGDAADQDQTSEPRAPFALCVLAVETAMDAALKAFDDLGRGFGVESDRSMLMLSPQRAATLKIINQRAAATGDAPVFLARAASANAAEALSAALAIADPALDLAYPLKGPFQALPNPTIAASCAALDMARHAGLLPAFLAHAVADASDLPDGMVITTPAALAAFADPAGIDLVVRARLPIATVEQAEIIAFRSADDPAEHIALVIGARDGSTPLVRLHSECLTGDVFGSLKCDCGPQLQVALQQMAGAQWGILLYLRQEGRGIGLINKLRAYQLQDQGFDTVDANIRLGFPAEARDFGIAARMLQLLGVQNIRLLTNNPQKVARLEAEGIIVVERVAHSLPSNPHNADYLNTKRDRTGHVL